MGSIEPGIFHEEVASKIYIDKSKLIARTNEALCTEQKYICVSRPRRFGKSMAANMLAAYMTEVSIQTNCLKILRLVKTSLTEKT
ncbi:MAG: AAA family ATPase [Mediterraneibacter faecis]